MERVQVSADKKGFVLAESGKRFYPWAYNLLHQCADHSIIFEDRWETDWQPIADCFHLLKKLGSDAARVFPQFAFFMDAPDKPNAKSLALLAKLVRLAEETGVYLDITGLSCFRTKDVPAWYDALSEEDRWSAQAVYFEAIAKVGAQSNAVFCYDLMNEPRAPFKDVTEIGWYRDSIEEYTFNQHIALDPKGRTTDEIGQQWVRMLVEAIRKQDKHGLITVGMLPEEPELDIHSGFTPEAVVDDLDFLCIHIYPRSANLDNSLRLLKRWNVGKPVVIEETYAIFCTVAEYKQFVLDAQHHCAGWFHLPPTSYVLKLCEDRDKFVSWYNNNPFFLTPGEKDDKEWNPCTKMFVELEPQMK